jgi:hypothetical protein
LTQHAQARGNNISESGNLLPNKVKENDFHWNLQKANAMETRDGTTLALCRRLQINCEAFLCKKSKEFRQLASNHSLLQ